MNQISTLGTLHDVHLTNLKYGVKDLLSAMEQFRPDTILTEIRTQFPAVEDAILDGGIEQAVLFAYASIHNISIIPTDWFDDDLLREMDSEGAKITESNIKYLEVLSKFRDNFYTSSLLDLNSDSYQGETRRLYTYFEEIGIKSYRRRNDVICENIKKSLATLDGRRILVIYGMDHKFFIDDFLRNLSNAKILDVLSWFDTAVVSNYAMSEDLKNTTLKNLKSAAATLKKRLDSNYYSEVMVQRMLKKQPKILSWIEAINDF